MVLDLFRFEDTPVGSFAVSRPATQGNRKDGARKNQRIDSIACSVSESNKPWQMGWCRSWAWSATSRWYLRPRWNRWIGARRRRKQTGRRNRGLKRNGQDRPGYTGPRHRRRRGHRRHRHLQPRRPARIVPPSREVARTEEPSQQLPVYLRPLEILSPYAVYAFRAGKRGTILGVHPRTLPLGYEVRELGPRFLPGG